jgi:YHS domain-containing protein
MKKTLFILGALATIAFVGTPALLADNQTNSVPQTNSVSSTPPSKPDLLKTCPVSGDKLGEMGTPFVFVYKGQQVKLCCPDCKADFDKNPAKYMKVIRAADKKQKKQP